MLGIPMLTLLVACTADRTSEMSTQGEETETGTEGDGEAGDGAGDEGAGDEGPGDEGEGEEDGEDGGVAPDECDIGFEQTKLSCGFERPCPTWAFDQSEGALSEEQLEALHCIVTALRDGQPGEYRYEMEPLEGGATLVSEIQIRASGDALVQQVGGGFGGGEGSQQLHEIVGTPDRFDWCLQAPPDTPNLELDCIDRLFSDCVQGVALSCDP